MRNYKVDVIIPTYKPDADLRKLLVRLKKQSYPIHKIIVINTEEKYWNTQVEKDIPHLQVYHITKEEFDHGGTRNLGASCSEADILVYMTQDAIPQNVKMIEELLKPFVAPEVKASYARQNPKKGCSVIEQYTRGFNYPDKSDVKDRSDLPELGIKTYFCSNVCAAYDRKTFEELGRFQTPSIFNEDMIYAAKLVQAGYAIAYAAGAKVLHSHNYTNKQQFRRNFDLAVSQADHPEIFEEVPSEGEGIRMVKKTAAYLCSIKKPWLVFPLLITSASKYAGYFMGKRYQKLSRKWIERFTMNPDYWNKIDR